MFKDTLSARSVRLPKRSHQSTRWVIIFGTAMKPSRLFAAGLIALTFVVSGCADFARLVTPNGSADNARPAQVALTTSVTTAQTLTVADVVQLNVTASYLLTGGDRAPIGNLVIPLTASASQAVPIPVDIAACLSDTRRDGADSDNKCPVEFVLSLVVNNVVVDNQTIGPLRLAPGATTAVSQPVALFEIATVELTSNETGALIIGASRTLAPVIRDARGAVVPGRRVSWRSESPAVATVSETGVVTGVTEGSARITATVGAATNAMVVNVTRPPVALSVVAPAIGSGTGLIQSSPSGISCRVTGSTVSGTCSAQFAAGAQVVLESVADAGQTFGAWGDACVGQAVGTLCTLQMAEARTVSARFLAPRRISIAAVNSDGRGRVTSSAGLDCRVDGSTLTGTCAVDVPDGATVVLTSTADAAAPSVVAQQFAGWGGACAASTSATCTLPAVSGPQNVTVGYYGGRTLTVVMAGDGGGLVTAASGVSCTRSNNVTTGTCAASFERGTEVLVSVAADAQSEFAGWSGACSNQTGSCSVSLTNAQTVTATFRRRVPLTIHMSGEGNGSILVNGTPVCSRESHQPLLVTCVKEYVSGSALTITSVAGELTHVAGITGDCVGQTTCVVTMNGPRTITAAYTAEPPVTLTIVGIATGSGTVRSGEAVPLIDCPVREGVASGPKCSARVPVGTAMTLTAVGDGGNALRFWTGACAATTTSQCAVTLTSSVSATVGFTPAIDVSMHLSGSGGGSVFFEPVGAPSQIPCVLPVSGAPVNCRFSLPTGLEGTFRGQAIAGSTFQGILGPCAESVGGAAVPVCTYRGVGFLRDFTAVFTGTP
jgi:hypothetical protein